MFQNGGKGFCSAMFEHRVLVHYPISRFHCESRRSLFKAVRFIDPKDKESSIGIDLLFDYSDPFNPKSSSWIKNLAFKMEKARRIAIAEGYDYLLCIHDDIIIPENTIPILLEYVEKTNADVLSGLYRLWKTRNPIICGTLSRKRLIYEKDLKGKDFLELYLICFGCMLVKNQVLKKIEFDGTDGTFAKQTEDLGFKKILIPSLKCGHINSNGQILWP